VLLAVAGLVIAAAGARIVTIVWWGSAGAAAYDDGRYGRAETSFERLGVLNPIERWRAPFGRGAALYRAGNLDAASGAFGDALELAPGRCETRFNLAVTLEARGDAMIGDEHSVEDIDNEAPFELYRSALDVINTGGCPSEAPDDAGDRLAQAFRRIVAKLGGEEQDLPVPDPGEGDSDDEPPDDETGTRSATDELERRNQLGAEQRDDVRDLASRDRPPAAQNDW